MRRKDDGKRDSIKKAVVQVILEQGMHAASVSKIAKAAGVSPATVYVYYESKDDMLRDIYIEYAENIYKVLLNHLSIDMPGDIFIDRFVREYYQYIIEYEEVFHFVEQFGGCPLSHGCHILKGPERLNDILMQYQRLGVLNNYDIKNIWAMLLYPVKAVVKDSKNSESTSQKQLDEMIMIIQKALLK